MIDTRTAVQAALGAAAGVIAVNALFVEPRRLVVSTHVVRRPERSDRVARIAQVSDLHLRGIGALERRIIAAVREARPDLIVSTGDHIAGRPALRALDRFLARLSGVAPVFGVMGNWDRWSGASVRELRAVFSRNGATLLVNESAVITVAGAVVRLTGVDDLVSGTPSARAGLDAARPGETHIVLAHCPGYRELLWREVAESQRPDWGGASPTDRMPPLMLSGHTHGGQIRVFGLAPVRPRGSGRYVAGWYRDARPHLYVSRGAGWSGIRARLGAPPEVAIFDVELPG